MPRPTFMERFEKSDIGAALIAEEKAETLARRTALVAERDTLKKAHDTAIESLIKVETAAYARVIAGFAEIKTARTVHVRALQMRIGRTSQYMSAVFPLEKELSEMENPALDAFLGELKAERERLDYGPYRGDETGGITSGGNPDVRNPKHEPVVKDTRPAAMAMRGERGERVAVAIKAVEALRLEALTEEELAARIGAIRQSVNGAVGGKAKK